jgi:hypothetical protein
LAIRRLSFLSCRVGAFARRVNLLRALLCLELQFVRTLVSFLRVEVLALDKACAVKRAGRGRRELEQRGDPASPPEHRVYVPDGMVVRGDRPAQVTYAAVVVGNRAAAKIASRGS